jgi:hypothetical protein
VVTIVWTLLLAAAVAWPSHALGLFDGIPLNGRAEAVAIGVIVPALWWLDRAFLQSPAARLCIGVLLAVKIASTIVPQQGWCARFTTTPPLSGQVLTMQIDEPGGLLRSWDVRADWRDASPRCTAILDRPYGSAAEFPAWFVNLLDVLRPGRSDLQLDVEGFVNAADRGTLTIRSGGTMAVRGRIDAVTVSASDGRDVSIPLDRGTHAVALRMTMTGDDWRLQPLWNGRDAWRTSSLSTAPIGPSMRAAASVLSGTTTALVVALLALWALHAFRVTAPSRPVVGWIAFATVLAIVCGAVPALARVSGVLALGSALVPTVTRERSIRTAFLAIGVPWLAFFVTHSFGDIGRFVPYSIDDWLAYQAAGYRVFMNGYWLEAGTRTFDYQGLYRWIAGALHIVFGDSSVGETYLDAACLLSGALLAFALVKPRCGYRAALFAASATLATFTLGTIWYFVGRGLSETAASGGAFLAAFFLLRARLGRTSAAAAAGVFAGLAFYARLNHLVFVVALAALLLPLSTATHVTAVRRRLPRVRMRALVVYLATIVAFVAAFMARTWWYTGVFSLLYGTSLRNNDTGLRFATLGSADVWHKVTHSLAALVWMNEPAHFDPRGIIVVGGVVAAAAAALQIPRIRVIPASIVCAIGGAMASALFVHTHNYPGRMTIHLVPFAAAALTIAVLTVTAALPVRTKRTALRHAAELR